MSRARHKREKGGEVWYNAEKSNVAKEAEDKKEGGDEGVSRKKGGKVHMHAEGEKAKMRHDRPKRASGGVVQRARGGRLRGGGVGADRTPLSTASKIKMVTKGEIGEDAEKSD